jgi:multiple sugar transport system permease protein
VRGGILLIVFRQFFRGLPYELEDAAHVDGAGPFRIFWQIMLPLAQPAILVVMLFSMVWTWNDNFTPWLVLRDNTLYTLTQRMEIFNSLLNNFSGSTYTNLEENTFMAGVTLTVLPLLLIYLFTQRYFTQSIDRTGLVE